MLEIRVFRKEKGWTQQQLAERIGTKSYTLAKWEQHRSEPCLEDLVKLSCVLEVSIDDMLGNSAINIPLKFEDFSVRKDIMDVISKLQNNKQYEVLGYAKALLHSQKVGYAQIFTKK